ncbi:ribulose-phosphate 3-epimerase [Bradyrhizobium sp. CCBAU 11430]|uniref:polysaccharide deacetylase family protein n=1 Tax=Bradyrhizobium sp. CCBAU 11430 TaxID=1630881 RepID=UPI00230646EC|nr:polysaccharide deacetylase [Bradyrhizobium sp. CCBAU 11430]MDA9513096.1 ribulose-phosphate 3-epimerase [Bradyrhizobium sp. CCBAU 11430]
MIDNPIQWPDGAKCAVAITFDMDSDSLLHCAHPHTADTLIGTASWLRYDRIAIPRILALYRKYNLKQTFFVPGWSAEHYPDIVKQIMDDGHDVGLHGYLHERLSSLSAEMEDYWFMRGLEALQKVTGVRPRGFRAPSYRFSKNTLNYLARERFVYDSSLMGNDVPYLIEGDKGFVVELPTDWALDDWPQFTTSSDLGFAMQVNSPDRAMDVFLADFEAAWEYGGLWISVWHPFVMGRLARCARMEKMIQYMLDRGGVWFATLDQIASHVNHMIESGKYHPATEQLPYHHAEADAWSRVR